MHYATPPLRVKSSFRLLPARALIGRVKVSVTVTTGRRTIPLEEVSDRRISSALEAAAGDIGKKLGRVRCPEHKQGPSNVRVHFDATGAADLRYDSCCDQLGQAVSRVLG
jgi:hypothetical protein